MANIVLPIQIEASWLTESYIERQVTQLITHYRAAGWGSIDEHFYDTVRINEDGWQPDTHDLVNISGPWGSSYTELAQKILEPSFSHRTCEPGGGKARW